jgi:SAM-dependent methyltransferase
MLCLSSASRKRYFGGSSLAGTGSSAKLLAMTDKGEWEGGVGRNWATEWERTDRSFAELTPRLLAAIAGLAGSDVVDIGCGAGELSLAVAAARPQARVLGIDVSADLVAAATMRARGRANCAFALADAATWEPDRGAPDLYISRHGVMFFADPVAAFAHLARVAQPAAGLCFSCFRSPADNPWASGIARLLPSGMTPPDPHAPGPFAFADPERVRSILERAGWRDTAFAAHDVRYLAGRGADPVADALDFFGRIGPAARAMRDLPEDELAGFQARLREFVVEHRRGDEVAFDAAIWIVTATKA